MSERSEHHPPRVEYNPGLLDRASGLLGRLGARQAVSLGGSEDLAAAPPVSELLDAYKAEGLASLDPESEAAQRLLASFMQSPQLERPLFLPGGVRAEADRALTIEATMQHPVELPVRNFVYAPDLQDWSGRDGHKSGASSGSSSQVIRDYARRRGEPPPIGYVVAYVQPNGRLLYAATQDGSHRIAAAHLRGDATVRVGGTILVDRLHEDVL